MLLQQGQARAIFGRSDSSHKADPGLSTQVLHGFGPAPVMAAAIGGGPGAAPQPQNDSAPRLASPVEVGPDLTAAEAVLAEYGREQLDAPAATDLAGAAEFGAEFGAVYGRSEQQAAAVAPADGSAVGEAPARSSPARSSPATSSPATSSPGTSNPAISSPATSNPATARVAPVAARTGAVEAPVWQAMPDSTVSIEVQSRINGARVGPVPLRITADNHIEVKLAGILQALRPFMDHDTFVRMISSRHAEEYVDYQTLRSAGIDMMFDKASGELVFQAA